MLMMNGIRENPQKISAVNEDREGWVAHDFVARYRKKKPPNVTEQRPPQTQRLALQLSASVVDRPEQQPSTRRKREEREKR